MNCLYIIGNGFDLAHGLKTSYCCFRRYLEKYQESFLIKLEEMYDFLQLLVEEYCWTEEQRKKALQEREERVLSSLWASIEEKLSFANEDDMISASIAAVKSLTLESGPIAIEDTLYAYWKTQYGFIKELQNNVFKWAKQVRLFKAKPKSKELLNNNTDLFLTFNYTSTLERIYRIPSSNILHIHGGVTLYSQRPVFGHGDKQVIEKYRKLARESDRLFDEGNKSIYRCIKDKA